MQTYALSPARSRVHLLVLIFAMILEVVMSTSPAQSQTTATAQGASPRTTEVATFASGCFWGTQYMLEKQPGVISTKVGYTGGHVDNPTYQQVCTGRTGHVEALEVVFDPTKTNYETLARMFFETHDPTQSNGQGPDIGPQYHSVIFYHSPEQKAVAEVLIGLLQAKGLKIATRVEPAAKFWPAEEYHQKYYDKNGKRPYCHSFHKLF